MPGRLPAPRDRVGQLLLSRSHQRAGAAWTDTATTGEVRGLKHRARADTRPVPAHPELVATLRRHLDQFPTGVGDHLFAARTGRAGVPLAPPYAALVSAETIYRVWGAARRTALTPQQADSMLARRPYDLRHACLSTWLNAGVPPAGSPSGQGTASTSCCGSTPTASTGTTRSPWHGSSGPQSRLAGMNSGPPRARADRRLRLAPLSARVGRGLRSRRPQAVGPQIRARIPHRRPDLAPNSRTTAGHEKGP